jgi:hypothetical protein
MSVEVMFVAIAGMVTFLAMIWIIGKAETDKARAKASSSEDVEGMKRLLTDNTAEISRLRARVEVLERLATDGDRRLAGDIERLRSEQRV